MRTRCLAASLLAVATLAAAGCASVELRRDPGKSFSFHHHAGVDTTSVLALEQAAPRASLADLDYAALDRPGKVRTRVSVESPAFRFDTGKSFVVGFRIDALPRPALIEIESPPVNPAARLALGDLLPAAKTFAPVAMLVDASFAVRETIQPEPPAAVCTGPERTGYALTVPITSDTDAAYLLIATTDALRATDGIELCGVVHHGLYPVGDIVLRVRALDFEPGPLLFRARSTLHRGSPEITLMQSLSENEGLLLLGETALHFAELHGDRYVGRFVLPYADVASARVQHDRRETTPIYVNHGELRLAYVDRATARPTYAIFETDDPHGALEQITPRLRPDVARDHVAFVAPASFPPIDFVAPTGEATARIGEAAVAGATLTAFPCGLCAAGICTPEMLAPCAGLAAVGGAIGGGIGVTRELIHALRGQQKPHSAPDASLRRSVVPKLAAGRPGRFDEPALRRCLASALGEGRWTEQGRTAILGVDDAAKAVPAAVSGDAESRPGRAYRFELAIESIALVADRSETADPRETPVRLRIKASVRPTVDGDSRSSHPISWTSDPHRLADWIDGDETLAARELQSACTTLAGDFVTKAEQSWRAD